jgi:hypothetical protein
VTSQITYQYGEETIVATALQDVTTVRANADHYIGTAKTIALKIPADADGLCLQVDITAIENDKLQTALQMLNSDEFRKPLELAPPIVGTALTVTSLVKKLFSSTDPKKQLQGSYPGVISQECTPQPLSKNRLVSGYLILISTDDDTDNLLQNLDESKLSVEGDTLRYDGVPMSNTYLVYNISLDGKRGVNDRAPWYAKYRESLLKLNELRTVVGATEQKKVYNAALALWNQANGLIESDRNYLEAERDEIQGAKLAELEKRYKDLTTPPPRLRGIIGSRLATKAHRVEKRDVSRGGIRRSRFAAEKHRFEKPRVERRNVLKDGIDLIQLTKTNHIRVQKAAEKYSKLLESRHRDESSLLEIGLIDGGHTSRIPRNLSAASAPVIGSRRQAPRAPTRE